jgi:hypothetical protein
MMYAIIVSLPSAAGDDRTCGMPTWSAPRDARALDRMAREPPAKARA